MICSEYGKRFIDYKLLQTKQASPKWPNAEGHWKSGATFCAFTFVSLVQNKNRVRMEEFFRPCCLWSSWEPTISAMLVNEYRRRYDLTCCSDMNLRTWMWAWEDEWKVCVYKEPLFPGGNSKSHSHHLYLLLHQLLILNPIHTKLNNLQHAFRPHSVPSLWHHCFPCTRRSHWWVLSADQICKIDIFKARH